MLQALAQAPLGCARLPSRRRPFAAPAARPRRVTCQAEPEAPKQPQEAAPPATPSSSSSSSGGGSVRDAARAAQAAQQGGGGGSGGRRRQADSTDWFATQLTRRFGLAGGLAWVGFLAFGVIGEQVKTRIEQANEAANTKDVTNAQEVVTPDGLRYTDLKVGGGSRPIPGYIIVLDYKATADGVVFEDTLQRGKPIVFLYGKRPFSGGVCEGVERALATMKAGGRRRVVVPPALGFGDRGAVLRPTEHVPGKQGAVPPGATLEYDLTLRTVSIPPS